MHGAERWVPWDPIGALGHRGPDARGGSVAALAGGAPTGSLVRESAPPGTPWQLLTESDNRVEIRPPATEPSAPGSCALHPVYQPGWW
jgi:hypothetical protein